MGVLHLTLITTEVHRTASRDVIVFAADRCVARGTRRVADQIKVFRMSTHSAGVGFFGLAEVPSTRGWQPMSDWLQDFLYRVRPEEPLETVASNLAAQLNLTVAPEDRESEPSGFHLAGFERGRPEFWFVRNVDDSGEPSLGRYEVREDYQRRDARGLTDGAYMIYRNGDLRVHGAVWEALDKALAPLLATPGFRTLETEEDYCSWVSSKMEVVARFYESQSEEPIISRPIDAFAFAAPESSCGCEAS